MNQPHDIFLIKLLLLAPLHSKMYSKLFFFIPADL